MLKYTYSCKVAHIYKTNLINYNTCRAIDWTDQTRSVHLSDDYNLPTPAKFAHIYKTILIPPGATKLTEGGHLSDAITGLSALAPDETDALRNLSCVL